MTQSLRSTQVIEYFEWNLLIVVQKVLQLPFADIKIFISERIWNVPTDWAKLPPILYNSMEERECKHELFILIGFSAITELSVIQICICSQKIRFETGRWLHRHFDRSL